MRSTRRDALVFLVSTALASPAWSRALAPAPSRRDDASRTAAFLDAVRAGDRAAVERMLAGDVALARATDAEGRSAFVLAHLHGHAAIAEALAATGLELDVVEAVLAGDTERVEALVAADPELVHRAHPIGGTPLHAAALGALGGEVAMYRLRSLGCESDARPAGGNGFTPARSAMDCSSLVGARLAATDLLSNGGDPNAEQRGGDSVLHGAVRRRSELLVRLAVRKGADVAARDARGRTARELAAELGWEEGLRLLAAHAELPRDCRASRFARDANGEPVRWIDLSDVPQELQSEVTSSSHANLARVRELVGADARLVFSISTDDELAIEACAHIGTRDIIRYHLDRGAPFSLPTAVSLGDLEAARSMLERDPRLVNERGAHDFPVMWYVALGGGPLEMAELLLAHGVPPDQESLGNTALHWCVVRGELDLMRLLLEAGADPDAVGYKWDRAGQTSWQLAKARGEHDAARLLADAGARTDA